MRRTGLGADGTGRQPWVCSRAETRSGSWGTCSVSCACGIHAAKPGKWWRGSCGRSRGAADTTSALWTLSLPPPAPEFLPQGRGNGRDVAKADSALVTLVSSSGISAFQFTPKAQASGWTSLSASVSLARERKTRILPKEALRIK